MTIDPISDALLFLHSEKTGRPQEPWTPAEMAELRRLKRPEVHPIVPDLYRAMVCHANGWTSRAGAADINQIESWMTSYYGSG